MKTSLTSSEPKLALLGKDQGQGACQAIEGAEALRVVLKGAELSDIEERLLIYDELRVERVRRIIENTRKMGPKRVGDGPRMSDREYSQYSVAFSDYHWSYSMTPEAIRLMNQPGIKMECADAATGQLVVLEGNDLGNGSLN